MFDYLDPAYGTFGLPTAYMPEASFFYDPSAAFGQMYAQLDQWYQQDLASAGYIADLWYQGAQEYRALGLEPVPLWDPTLAWR